tara:strand:+ start:1103 stop:1423 length:321 start_codon:yes stop_codon:yes gene_type:complete
MNNKSITIAGIMLITSTILLNFIFFFMEYKYTFNLTSAFILGAVNIMALHFINVIFKFKIDKEEIIALIPTILISIKNNKLGIIFLNRSLEIKLKYKSIEKPININ